MDVTDVLRDRMREPGGFQRMLTVSLAAHVLVAAAMVLAPRGFLGRPVDSPREVMTISLAGGGEGPRNGGFTTIGARPVQQVTPPDEPPKREAVRPPAAKAPDMTLPTKPSTKPVKPSTAPDIKQSPDQARGRTPTKGKEITPGTAIADTGARGQGFGLSTGGGPGSGSSLDVADFCCPDYIVTMIERIRSSWVSNQGTAGQSIVKFTIQRDGRVTGYEVERSSGSPVLDLAALRAVAQTRSLPPLPAQFPNPTLTVHLNFQYQ
jgi:TonB family protein